jgi:methionyl-tRNA formyltransferase
MEYMKILFAGSPDSSAQILKSLHKDTIEIVGVISQPDKRSKRGKDIEPSAVSIVAEDLGLPLFKPLDINYAFKETISGIKFDFLVVSAYGKILPTWLLDMPNKSSINVHFSLLPKYRGASPIQAAILNSDQNTGISIMKMTSGLDEGPIYSMHNLEILNLDTKKDLEEKLTLLSIKVLKNDLEQIFSGKLQPLEQEASGVEYCKKITKISGIADFANESANSIIQKFKAYHEWPGLFFVKNDTTIKIHGLLVTKDLSCDYAGNDFQFTDDGILVKTVDKNIVITHLQFPGKRIITAKDASNSYSNFFEE